jgi:cytohesin
LQAATCRRTPNSQSPIHVAQAVSLLYRGLAIRSLPTANLRYGMAQAALANFPQTGYSQAMNRKLLILRLAAFVLVMVALIGLVGCNKVRAIDDAVKRGDLETVKALLKNHPDLVSSKDKDGWTPLEFAAMFGHKDMVELLLAKGADVNSKDTACGRTPLHYARNESVAELLLTNKAEVDARGKGGETPLFMVVLFGHKDVVESLLAHGADVNAKINNGETPLYGVQNKETAELLLAHGAGVNVKDNIGETPLHKAWNTAITELLLTNHADVNAKNKNGETPLHTVARSGLKDIVEVLLAHGADVNAKDNQGRTPLHDAAECGWQDVVELLVANKADVNAKDNKAETPMFLAESKGQINWTSKKVAEWLRQHGGQE